MINEQIPTPGCCAKSGTIFILGIMPRSGTNFLHDLLCLHPDCVPGGIIWEDFVLAYSDLLFKYSNATYKHYNSKWKVDEKLGPPDFLCQCLGQALLSFLNLQLQSNNTIHESSPDQNVKYHNNPSQQRLVTKTPVVNNLSNFPAFVPASSLIIVIRDGRSVVESGVKTFNWNYEKAMRRWASAADTILQFVREKQNTGDNFIIVKYEDLYKDKEGELRRIFPLLGLNSENYDFGAAMNLSIRGSSQLSTNKKVHWESTEKIKNFNPIARCSHWSRAKHERFNWIAKDCIEPIGYERHGPENFRLFWLLWNVIMDLKWKIATVKARVRSIIKAIIQRDNSHKT
jgi:sulfotransferase family protein